MLPDFEAELPRRHLAADLELIVSKAVCEDLVPMVPDWYDYKWNTDGCYCEHVWNLDKNVVAPAGEVLNPFYQAGAGNEDRYISPAAYDLLDLNKCGDPTCEEIIGPDPEFASAYLATSGSNGDLNNVSKWETGVV